MVPLIILYILSSLEAGEKRYYPFYSLTISRKLDSFLSTLISLLNSWKTDYSCRTFAMASMSYFYLWLDFDIIKRAKSLMKIFLCYLGIALFIMFREKRFVSTLKHDWKNDCLWTFVGKSWEVDLEDLYWGVAILLISFQFFVILFINLYLIYTHKYCHSFKL